MIANIVTDKKGNPIDGNGKKLNASTYTPPEEVKKLFARVQQDYSVAWRLQHRTFDEFDGMSLLDRARIDQETFGAYVGAYVGTSSREWRWRGRKNTARNKIIGLLAHMLAGMLFPYCYAYNEKDDADELSARVMRILVEDHLKKAQYETKFLFMVLSALVNPAVHVEVEYVEALQRIKSENGTVEEAVDILLSGIGLNILPIDQILPLDFFTSDIQRQPGIARLRRISYDEARSVYAGKYFINGVDQFDFVEAGKTRVFLAGQEHQTLYDIEWTEGDANMVQEITMFYRGEDLEVTFVGGVFMGNHEDIYNRNRFHHRRMSLIGNEWKSIPVYPFAKIGFEPIDPTGRFYYYKSAAFKEFWDDAAQNRMHQLAYDGTYLDVIKPMFMSGVAKVDSSVIVPGATVAMPLGANVTPYNLSPNINAALTVMRQETEDMSESTQDKIAGGVAQAGVTATATVKAEQNARIILGVFSVMIADLVRQIGDLTIDCIIQHETVGEVDALVPGGLTMKYRKFRTEGMDGGRKVINKVEFDSSMVGKEYTQSEIDKLEWQMFDDAGGVDGKNRLFKVNPYKFARTAFNLRVDPSQIISRSFGTDQIRRERAFQILMSPVVAPYVNQEAVVNRFVLDEYSDGDPDEFRKKKDMNADPLQSVMGAAPNPLQANMALPSLPANQPQQ